MNIAVPAEHRLKWKERGKKDTYMDIARELKKTVDPESDSYTKCNWCSMFSNQMIVKRIRGLGNNSTSGGNPNDITEIGQNNEKNPGDLRRLVVTQTPVRDHQVTLLWKTLKEK